MDRAAADGRIREYLSARLCCTPEALEGDGVLFVPNDRAPAPFLELCTMGRAVIVSASRALLPRIEPLLRGKSRDEMFECPLVYGQSLYSVPDPKVFRALPLDPQYTYTLLQDEAVQKLRGIAGFENSLAFDAQGHTSTCIVLYAEKDGAIAGLAGASREAAAMWEIGVDVRPSCRGGGLASILVSRLAQRILEQDILPFYCASVTNIASQAVAHRSGFIPRWVSSYRTVLDGSSAYPMFFDSTSWQIMG